MSIQLANASLHIFQPQAQIPAIPASTKTSLGRKASHRRRKKRLTEDTCIYTGNTMWLRKLFDKLNFLQPTPAKLLLDNQSAIALASNPQFHTRSKHIDIRHHFIQSCIADGQVQLYWCPTNEMIADILTKSLPYPKFNLLSHSMGMLASV